MATYDVNLYDANTKLQNAEVIIIDDIPPYDFKDYDIFDEKDFKKYVDDIEKIVRSSFEYREFINYLREYMDMNTCSFFENISNKNSFKIKIHIHHHPLTLYDIVMTVYQKRSFFNESLEVEMVAKEAMYVHYFLMVGLIPVSETVHELIHGQVLFVPIDKVMGNWEEFMETYQQFIPLETQEKIDRYKQKTLSFNEVENRKILMQKPTYIQLMDEDGSYKEPNMNQIIDAMNNRIQDIKNNRLLADKSNTDKYDNNVIEPKQDQRYIPMYIV